MVTFDRKHLRSGVTILWIILTVCCDNRPAIELISAHTGRVLMSTAKGNHHGPYANHRSSAPGQHRRPNGSRWRSALGIKQQRRARLGRKGNHHGTASADGALAIA